MTVKLSVSLTDQQAAYARRQVEEGRFPSTSAVIQQALEAKRREDEEYQAWKSEFFSELRSRVDGPHRPAEETDRRIDALIARRRSERGLEN